jgi:hypothetical protein
VGNSAVEEIMAMRPFSSIEEMLYREDGSWRLSKFNRKSLEALIKVEAFGSLGCVGPDKLFKSYRHMHETLMGTYTEVVPRRKGSDETVERVRDHAAMIKRSPKVDPHEGRRNLFALARGLAETFGEEWSRKEVAQNHAEIFGSVDIMTMFDPGIFDKLGQKGVASIEDLEVGQTDLVWFVTVLASGKKQKAPSAGSMKRTRNGKEYAQIFVAGPTGKPIKVNVWGAKQINEPYKLICAEVKRDDFGFSSTTWKMREIA